MARTKGMGRVQWEEVDWSLPNCVIAKKLGCTCRHVSYKRAALGLLRSPYPSKHPLHLFNWDLPNCDLARIWGLPPLYVGKRRHHRRSPPSPWDRRCGRIPTDPEYQQALAAEREKAEQYQSGQDVEKQK